MACEQKVRVWSDDKGVEVGFKLLCKDKCKKSDAQDCTEKEYTGGSGTLLYVVHYCACDGGKGRQAEGCQIVLRVQKGGDNDGKKSIACDGNGCKDGEECVPVPVPGSEHDVAIPSGDGKYRGTLGKRTDYRCECKPKAKRPK